MDDVPLRHVFCIRKKPCRRCHLARWKFYASRPLVMLFALVQKACQAPLWLRFAQPPLGGGALRYAARERFARKRARRRGAHPPPSRSPARLDSSGNERR